MYFVTMKQPGYALFATTPSERAAIGLTDDQQHVHVLRAHAATTGTSCATGRSRSTRTPS